MTTDLLRANGLTGYVDVFHADVPSAVFAKIIAERNRRCKIVANALATAFGGQSQVSAEDIGRAVVGQVSNNGLGCYGTAEELIAVVYDAGLYAGDDHYPPDEPDYDAVMPIAVGTYYDCGGDSDLPRRHYVSMPGGY